MRAAPRGVSWDAFCERACALPGVTTGTSYGTPGLRVGKKFLARLKEDGESVALRIGFAERDVLLAMEPEAFYLTDHYLNYPAVLVRLKALPREMLGPLLEQAWRQQATPRLLAQAPAASAPVVPEKAPVRAGARKPGARKPRSRKARPGKAGKR